MRKALVGIAAALMLATLVIAIPPAYSADFLYGSGQYQLSAGNPGGYDPLGYFTLSTTYLVCASSAAVVVQIGPNIYIAGACQTGAYRGGILIAGGNALTGPIRLRLFARGMPTPLTLVMYPSPGPG